MAVKRNTRDRPSDRKPADNPPLNDLLGQLGPPVQPVPTVRIANPPPDEPELPGFAMADAEEDLEHVPSAVSAASDAPALGFAVGDPAPAVVDAAPAPFITAPAPVIPQPDHAQGEIYPPLHPSGSVRYESRITILEAYRYPGNLATAPDWVDRNWIAYGDYDPLRGIEPGPALRVPASSGIVTLARPGDYVVKQRVKLFDDIPDDVRIEVWSSDQFEKMFLPVDTLLSQGQRNLAYESS